MVPDASSFCWYGDKRYFPQVLRVVAWNPGSLFALSGFGKKISEIWRIVSYIITKSLYSTKIIGVDACLPVALDGHRYFLVNFGTTLLTILQVTETAHVIIINVVLYV